MGEFWKLAVHSSPWVVAWVLLERFFPPMRSTWMKHSWHHWPLNEEPLRRGGSPHIHHHRQKQNLGSPTRVQRARWFARMPLQFPGRKIASDVSNSLWNISSFVNLIWVIYRVHLTSLHLVICPVSFSLFVRVYIYIYIYRTFLHISLGIFCIKHRRALHVSPASQA